MEIVTVKAILILLPFDKAICPSNQETELVIVEESERKSDNNACICVEPEINWTSGHIEFE